MQADKGVWRGHHADDAEGECFLFVAVAIAVVEGQGEFGGRGALRGRAGDMAVEDGSGRQGALRILPTIHESDDDLLAGLQLRGIENAGDFGLQRGVQGAIAGVAGSAVFVALGMGGTGGHAA